MERRMETADYAMDRRVLPCAHAVSVAIRAGSRQRSRGAAQHIPGMDEAARRTASAGRTKFLRFGKKKRLCRGPTVDRTRMMRASSVCLSGTNNPLDGG